VKPKEEQKPVKKDKFERLLAKLSEKGLLSESDLSGIKED